MLKHLFVAPAALFYLIFSAALSSAAAQVSDSQSILPRGPIPQFVILREAPTQTSEPTPREIGADILLVDIQHDATAAGKPVFTRIVSRAASARGAESLSVFSIPYAPAYQNVVLNRVVILRNGVAEDRADRLFTQFAQHEEQSASNIFTGIASIFVRIEDVRPGDIVEIAYTVTGQLQSLGEKDVKIFPMTFGVPVEQYFIRSLWPGPPIIGKNPSDIKVRQSKAKGKNVVEIGPTRLSGDVQTANLFSTPSISITLTDFSGWDEVAEWGAAFYSDRSQKIDKTLLDEIFKGAATTEDKIIAALRYVQNEIKYSAILLGENGYVPTPVQDTLRSRFGDCKAKSLLFLTLLDEIGVSGTPALVNTSEGFNLGEFVPSPIAFNHLVVRVNYAQREIWVDPTISNQGGNFDALSSVDYGGALLLDDEASGLQSMAASPDLGTQISLKEVFDLTDGAQPATVTISTTYRGESADQARSLVDGLGSDKFLEIISMSYGRYGKTDLKSSSIDDDKSGNVISTNMVLTISQPFSEPDSDKRKYFRYFPYPLTARIANYGDADPPGDIPLDPNYVFDGELEIILPEMIRWELSPVDKTIEAGAFNLTSKAEQQAGKYVLKTRYEPLLRAVSPKDYKKVVQAQQDVDDSAGYTIWIRSPSVAIEAADGPPKPNVEFDIPIPEFDH